jgi:acyl dehydratase
MRDHPISLPLPPMSAATLLRALFKRPSTAGAAVAGVAASTAPTRHVLAGIDDAAVARYRAALGFGGSHVPLPFRLAGAIHVDNALSAGIQPLPGRPLALETTVEVGPPAANGAVHAALATRALQDGEPVFACRSTYLVVRGRRSGGPHASVPAPAALAPLVGWQLSSSSGREYASLSGDWNPIHLWPWTARLMGLPGPIIHGMHTLGRTCADLERAGGRPVAALDGRFRAPIALPGAVALAADLGAGRYTVGAGGRVAVEGGFRFA